MDLGWSELLLIGVVALIVIGPKDLPHLFRSLGRFTAKARAMAREFSSAMEEAARNSGLDEATKSLHDVKSLTSKKNLGLDALDRAADKFEKWDPKIPTAKTTAQPDPGSPKATPTATPPATPKAASATASATASTSATATPAVTTGATDVTGKRRIRAVRRSDMKDT